jgi:hypothetical protein
VVVPDDGSLVALPSPLPDNMESVRRFHKVEVAL